ncbi:sulfotransferase family protein [Marinobacter sp.]|uniref:sulfotransferase family protein n=1 Tax=Marinobacter sp. TaxID=50741 RepID=UPI0035656AB3
MKPNFIIIGAARSGTTSLYLYLDQHPEIYFSPVKEINFFSNPRIWKKGFGWYERHFNRAKNAKAIGEASTSYTVSPFLEKAAERISDYRADVKLLYIVRDPISRLMSHYRNEVHRGVERRSFSEMVRNIEHETIGWQGRYNYQLEQFLKFFAREQILVLSFDELHKSSKNIVRDIFGFLGVDEDFPVSNIQKVYNASSGHRRPSNTGVRILKFYRRYVEQTRAPFIVKNQFFKLSEIGSEKQSKPSLTDSDYQILLDFYKDDTAELSKKFGIDTSGWLRR